MVDHEFRPDATAIFKGSGVVVDRVGFVCVGKGLYFCFPKAITSFQSHKNAQRFFRES